MARGADSDNNERARPTNYPPSPSKSSLNPCGPTAAREPKERKQQIHRGTRRCTLPVGPHWPRPGQLPLGTGRSPTRVQPEVGSRRALGAFAVPRGQVPVPPSWRPRPPGAKRHKASSARLVRPWTKSRHEEGRRRKMWAKERGKRERDKHHEEQEVDDDRKCKNKK